MKRGTKLETAEIIKLINEQFNANKFENLDQLR